MIGSCEICIIIFSSIICCLYTITKCTKCCKSDIHPIVVEQDIITDQPNLVYGIENNNLPKYGEEEVIYGTLQVYKANPPPNYIP